jgi:thermitase
LLQGAIQSTLKNDHTLKGKEGLRENKMKGVALLTRIALKEEAKMKHRSLLMAFGVLVVTLFSVSAALAATHAWVPDPANWNVPGELIIGFSPKTTLTQINSAVSSVGGKIMANHSAPKGRVTRIKLQSIDPSAVQKAMNQLKSNPAFKNVIRYVEPNVIRKALGARLPSGDASAFDQTSDQLLSEQWGYYDIDANWPNAPTTTKGVTVAVIDTGVDYNHPDLIGQVIKGYDYVNADTNPMDDFGHGTTIAGIIAAKANNNYGITGVSPNSKILAIKVLNSSGYGSDYDISLGIYAAANNSSVKVINMSLGGPETITEDDAVEYAVVTKGKLLVAAAGNDNTNDPTNAYPAALSIIYPNMVLAVAAHDQAHCRAAEDLSNPFSNYGTWISISAPGYEILSIVPISVPTPFSFSGFEVWDGTSLAAPHVSGAAALAWQKFPTYTNAQIGSLITTLNAGTDSNSPLLRDGTCWPNDGSTFQRLDVLAFLEQQFFPSAISAIYGYAFDAETGLPLAGAKVTAKEGTTTAIDYVPDFGTLTYVSDTGTHLSGYGLFNVLTLAGSNSLTIQETGYMTFSPKNQAGLPVTIPVIAGEWNYAGNFPVPPQQPLYWLAITWSPDYTGYYELEADVYQNSVYQGTIYYDDVGDLNTYPYALLFWDSFNYFYDLITYPGDPRTYAETINIRKLLPGGEFVFYVYDEYNGPSSTSWTTSGITAYLFKGNQLVKTYTGASATGGSGEFWIINEIVGTTITDENYLTN